MLYRYVHRDLVVRRVARRVGRIIFRSTEVGKTTARRYLMVGKKESEASLRSSMDCFQNQSWPRAEWIVAEKKSQHK